MSKEAAKREASSVFVAKPVGQGRVSREFVDALRKTGASDQVIAAASRKAVASKTMRASKKAHYRKASAK